MGEVNKEKIGNYQSEELQSSNEIIYVFSENTAKRKYLNYFRKEGIKVSILNSIEHWKGRQTYATFLHWRLRGKD